MEGLMTHANHRLHAKSTVRRLLIELFDEDGNPIEIMKPSQIKKSGGGSGGYRKPLFKYNKEVSVNIYIHR